MRSGSHRVDIENMNVVEYVVSDDPIMGKVIVTHYIEEVKGWQTLRK